MSVLNAIQKTILDNLKERIADLASELISTSPTDFYKPKRSNVIGIFGSRGAGKSTLLLTLFNKCKDKKCCTPDKFLSYTEKLFLIKPIDCSILRPKTPPSAIVLLAIKESLKSENLTNLGLSTCINKLEIPLRELDDLIGKCTRTEKAYRKLCLELSTSPDDYDHYQEVGIQERFDLENDLKNCLTEIRKVLADKTLVILLDDFDLSSADQVHAWISALLDELRQPGLIFIATADFFRLEHLSWDAKKQCDDKTGRALINKIFPPQNCIQLPEWTIQEALQFPYDETKSVDSLEKSLDKLLEKSGRLTKPIVWSLLPRLPRGIENLYNKLPSINSEKPDEFLNILATCRSEPLFARLLKERKNQGWLHELPISKKKLSVEEWDGLVASAYQRPLGENSHLPILRNLLEHPKPAPKNIALEHYNDEHAPLWHQEDTINPMRDTILADQNLWAELLLDLSFQNTKNTSHLKRSYLCSSWAPIIERLKDTHFQFIFSDQKLRAFFTNNEGILTKSNLAWLSHEYNPNNTSSEHFQIGWQPLFKALRGDRDPLSNDMLTRLLINPRSLQGELPDKTELDILPDKLWALIVFSDALHRCPWRDFSTPSIWLVVTYVILAAAFVRTAYIYTLLKSNAIEKCKLSQIQKTFILLLEKRDAGPLFPPHEKDEKALLLHIHALFNDGLFQIETRPEKSTVTWLQPLKDNAAPLKNAAEQFFGSSLYLDAVEKLADTLSFYRISPP